MLASLDRWPGSNIWYAAASLPWFTLLVYQGFRLLPFSWLARVAPWLLVSIFAASGLAGGLLRMIPAYSQSAISAEALERLASLQPPFLGTSTLVLSVAIWLALLIAALVSWRRLSGESFAGPESPVPGT